jgi:cytochrome c2
VDTGDWTKISRALIDAGTVALKAIEAKNAEALLASGEAINESCDNCHEKYQRSDGAP